MCDMKDNFTLLDYLKKTANLNLEQLRQFRMGHNTATEKLWSFVKQTSDSTGEQSAQDVSNCPVSEGPSSIKDALKEINDTQQGKEEEVPTRALSPFSL